MKIQNEIHKCPILPIFLLILHSGMVDIGIPHNFDLLHFKSDKASQAFRIDVSMMPFDVT